MPSIKDAPSSRGHGSKAAVGHVSSTKLNVGKLTRNVTSDHISEIFATFGKIKTAELQVSIPILSVTLAPDVQGCSAQNRIVIGCEACDR